MKSVGPTTTAQSLGALLKSARDIMLTWIMLLKFLLDLDLQREDEAKLAGKKFKPAVEPPYRWRDWAARSDGITGDELLPFINNEETARPDGKRGAGLFRYLRTLKYQLTDIVGQFGGPGEFNAINQRQALLYAN